MSDEMHPPMLNHFKFSEEHAKTITRLLGELQAGDEEQAKLFVVDLEYVIHKYMTLRRIDKESIASGQIIADIKKVQKHCQALNSLLQQLPLPHRQWLHYALQEDLYRTGEVVPERTPWNREGRLSFNLGSDPSPYFDALKKELDRLDRLCQGIKAYPLKGGRRKQFGPEHLAADVAQAYRTRFNRAPASTRDGPFEQLVRFVGDLAGFVIADWHQYIVK